MGALTIDWTVASPDSRLESPEQVERDRRGLDYAAEIIKKLSISPLTRLKIEVVLVEENVQLDRSHVDYYVKKPTFKFYISVTEDPDTDMLTVLPLIVHELVHYRTSLDWRYRQSSHPVISEEASAYAAANCSSIWLSHRQATHDMSIVRAKRLSAAEFSEAYFLHGASYVSRFLGDELIFGEYPQSVESTISEAAIPKLMVRCEQVVKYGQGLNLTVQNDIVKFDLLEKPISYRGAR